VLAGGFDHGLRDTDLEGRDLTARIAPRRLPTA